MKKLTKLLLTLLFVLPIIPHATVLADSNPGILSFDLNPGSGDSAPTDFIQLNDTVYFAANDGTHGTEPWKSDGTSSGTMMVKDIYPGMGSSPGNFTVFNDEIYFTAYTTNLPLDLELWKTDGTEAGTVLVKDINRTVGVSPNIVGLTACHNSLFFEANDGAHGHELWKTDGTEAGTVLVKDISSYSLTHASTVACYQNDLYFSQAIDRFSGNYLWKSDGTDEGTVMVGDALWPSDAVEMEGELYFVAGSGDLWKSDGTDEGTVMVKEINPGIRNGLVLSGNNLFFQADDGTHGRELWKSDGTETGTMMVKDIEFGAGWSEPTGLTDIDGKIYFSAYTSDYGHELWKSDGTETGTMMVKDILGGDQGSNPENLLDIEGIVFFDSVNNEGSQELWRSDGTRRGTFKIKNLTLNFGEATSKHKMHYFPELGMLFFSGFDETNGTELWICDVVGPKFANFLEGISPINVNDGEEIDSNPFKLQVKPEDNIEVSYVDFYVDDNLICTAGTPDANGVYSCAWDTSLYHSDVKVIAYDTTGNESSPLLRSTRVDLRAGVPNTGYVKNSILLAVASTGLGLLLLAGNRRVFKKYY